MLKRDSVHTLTPYFAKLTISKLWLFFIVIGLVIRPDAPVFSQLRVYSVNKGSGNSAGINLARTKAGEILTLPFWDDFSKPYQQFFPDPEKWESGFTVTVNNGLAVNPRTYNVVSFDGLDSAGLAYSSDILSKGFADSLVSQRIDLAVLTPTERNTVYLSFAYQWQGNGEAPDRDDYLQIEFKNNLKKWEVISSINYSNELDRMQFYDAVIRVEGERFFHSEFQFRIKNYGRRSGPFDGWNIDYVYMNKNRTATDLSFPDRAIASELGSFLGTYSAVPLNHFALAKEFTVPYFDIRNLSYTVGASLNYNAKLNINTFSEGSEASATVPLGIDNQLEPGSTFLAPLTTINVKTLPLPDINLFDENADSIKFDVSIFLKDQTGDNSTTYDPIDFRENDTIQRAFIMKDFYAYDDGVAEYSAGLSRSGELVAYQFDIPENVPLSSRLLEKFMVYFPPHGISGSQPIDFFVYYDNNGVPGEVAVRQQYTIQNKGLNTFQTVRFIPPVTIAQNKFYIGWRQPVSGSVKIGLDINQDVGDKVFVNTNGSWYQNVVVHGALMIRPVFTEGEGAPVTAIEEEQSLSIYPNPSQGEFMIDGNAEAFEVITITGKPVPFQVETLSSGKQRIRLSQPAGIYLLHYTTSEGRLVSHKLIVRP